MPTTLGHASILTDTVTLLGPGAGVRAGAGVGWSVRASSWCSQLTDSSPGLLLGSPSGQAPCASPSWGVTWMRSRFPGAGIGWIKQAPWARTSLSCWQDSEQRMGHPDADANSSLAPSFAHVEGKTAARAAPGQSSSRPEAPVLCQSLSRRLLLLPCWKTRALSYTFQKHPSPSYDFRLKRQKMRVPVVCSMFSFTGDTTHTAQWHHGLLGISRGIFGIVQSWQSLMPKWEARESNCVFPAVAAAQSRAQIPGALK